MATSLSEFNPENVPIILGMDSDRELFHTLNPIAYLLSSRCSQLDHVLMTFDFPRFTNSERTNEMTLNKAVAFEEVAHSCLKQ